MALFCLCERLSYGFDQDIIGLQYLSTLNVAYVRLLSSGILSAVKLQG